MACSHRFFRFHRTDNFSLFPDWKVDYLIVGTFNPNWHNPNNNNADYFYGRSRYMWRALSIFFTGIDSELLTLSDKMEFAKRYGIGFTDLIVNISNAQESNSLDRRRIFSFKDVDIESFGGDNIQTNTDEIKEYLKAFRPPKLLFTLLSRNPNTLISENIAEVERCAHELGIPSTRLHTPTGQGLGKGTPRINKLIEKWDATGMFPTVDLIRYPYI